MGYKLTSLVNLPIDERVDMYIFAIGGDLWEGGLAELVHRNFDQLAKAIGPRAIIVGGLTDSFHGEVVERYLGEQYKSLKNMMPALLITDAHPDKLTKESMRLIVPLKEAHKRYEIIDRFLSDLAAFARGEDDSLLRALEAAPKPTKVANDIVEVKIPIVPGAVAVNVNHVLGSLRSWWTGRRESRARFVRGTTR